MLFLVAVLAAFIDSIAGGGGLLTVPSLLAAGLSPAQALATNKLQSVGGSFSASLYFVRRGAVKLRAAAEYRHDFSRRDWRNAADSAYSG